MITPFSAHRIRQIHQRTPALMLLLLCLLSLKVFATDNPEHYIQPDQHCAMCLSSISLGHGFVPHQPTINVAVPLPEDFITAYISYHSITTVTARNRGPPN